MVTPKLNFAGKRVNLLELVFFFGYMRHKVQQKSADLQEGGELMTGYDRCASEAAAIEHVIAAGKAKTKAEARRFLLLNIPREAVYQKKILDYLKKEYPQAFVFKAAAGPYSRGGVPDIIAVIDGQFYGFEVKRPYYGKLSPLQKASIKRINDAGGVAAVVTFPEDVAKLIRGRE